MKPILDQKIQQINLALKEGKFEEVELLSKDILKSQPTYPGINHTLAIAQQKMGKLNEAETSYKKAIDLKPDYADAHYNLGFLLRVINKLDEAEERFKKAIEIKPDLVQAYNALGGVQQKLGKLNESEISYKKAIELKPDYSDAYMNLGITLYKKNKFNEAETIYKKAIEIKPDYAEAHYNLGNFYNSQKRIVESLVSYKRAYALDPDIDFLPGVLQNVKMHLCIWDNFSSDINEITKKINKGEKVIAPLVLLALVDDPKIHRKASETFYNDKVPRSNFFPKIPDYYEHKKIRIGYFSGDFRKHPIARLTTELYEIHDREKFEIYAFSIGPDKQDEFNIRIKKSVDHFYNVQMMSDDDVVRLSRSLEIDIAIDLTGFTTHARMGIFARLVAPIQVNYLGYTGTMGANYHDYYISDKNIITEKNKKYSSEKIVYMPNSYLVDISKVDVSEIKLSRYEMGLPETGFVFCCFNYGWKITLTTFAGWMRILKATDDSVLWLLIDNITAKKNLKQEAIKFGINEDRLIFAKKLPLEEHLKRIQLADLFLDTLPYNAHLTASDALRMELPLLTCVGHSFASRVAASLLKAVNLPELITTTQDEYESLAIKLAKDPERLKILKDKLINSLPTSPLYDSKLFTSHLEAAYLTMYKRYQDGLNPIDIEVKN